MDIWIITHKMSTNKVSMFYEFSKDSLLLRLSTVKRFLVEDFPSPVKKVSKMAVFAKKGFEY